MKKWHRRDFLIPLILFLLAAFLHLINLENPREVIFDEVHYGNFTIFYLKGESFFDVHPPLGKLILLITAWWQDMEQKMEFKKIGQPYPKDVSIFILRFLPAFFGSMLIPLIYFLAQELFNSKQVALVSSFAILFNNCFIVHSRWMGIDMFLLFFLFLALLSFLKASPFKNRKPNYIYLTIAAIFSAFALSIKWIGLIAWAMILSISPYWIKKIGIRKFLLLLLVISITIILIYYLFFLIHFSLISHLKNRHSPGWLRETLELNKQMFMSQLGKLKHPYQSKWYQWLIMKRAVSYYQKVTEKNGKFVINNITLLGNPFIWLLTLLGISGYIIWSIVNFWHKLPPPPASSIIIAGYLISLIPFALIKRSLFLYHYFPALIFATLASAYLLNHLLATTKGQKLVTFLIFIINLAALAFLLSRLTHFNWKQLHSATKIGIFILGFCFLLQLFLILGRIRNKKRFLLLLLFMLALGTFLLFLPLSYALTTNYTTFYYLMWSPYWI